MMKSNFFCCLFALLASLVCSGKAGTAEPKVEPLTRVTFKFDAQMPKDLQTEMWHPSEFVVFDVSLGLIIESKGFGANAGEVGHKELLFDIVPSDGVRAMRFGVQNIGMPSGHSSSLFPTICDSPLFAEEDGRFRAAFPRGFYEIPVAAHDAQLLKDTFCVLISSDGAVSRVYQHENTKPNVIALIIGAPPYKLSWIKLNKLGEKVSPRIVKTAELRQIEEARLFWRKR